MGFVTRHASSSSTQHVRRRHPVQRLVCAAVGMDGHTAVGLDHDETLRSGQVSRQSPVVVDGALRNDKTHDVVLAPPGSHAYLRKGSLGLGRVSPRRLLISARRSCSWA